MSETSNEEAKNEEAKNGISQEAREMLDKFCGGDATRAKECLESAVKLLEEARQVLAGRDFGEAGVVLARISDEVADAQYWNALALRRELRTYRQAVHGAANANLDQSSPDPCKDPGTGSR